MQQKASEAVAPGCVCLLSEQKTSGKNGPRLLRHVEVLRHVQRAQRQRWLNHTRHLRGAGLQKTPCFYSRAPRARVGAAGRVASIPSASGTAPQRRPRGTQCHRTKAFSPARRSHRAQGLRQSSCSGCLLHFSVEICTRPQLVSRDHTVHVPGQDSFSMRLECTGQTLNLIIFGNKKYFVCANRTFSSWSSKKKSGKIVRNNANEKGVLLTYMPNIKAPVSSRTWIRSLQMTISAELIFCFQ